MLDAALEVLVTDHGLKGSQALVILLLSDEFQGPLEDMVVEAFDEPMEDIGADCNLR
jgi:hypothetical protein